MPVARKIINILYRLILRPLLFKINPEKIHDWFTAIGYYLGRHAITKQTVKVIFRYQHHSLEQNIAGLTFTNPVGLAAGFDKDGYMAPIMPAVGFGFTEVGSVTAAPYQGNPKPRLFRLPQSRSIVVNYGLKNEGVHKITNRLQNNHTPDFPTGTSIAKTNCKQTANARSGIEDYATTLQFLTNKNFSDFYTINISCPNAFGGEPFTTPDLLGKLLTRLDTIPHQKPVFIKMPIGISWPDFKTLLEVITRHNVTGVIIGNLNKNHQDPAVKDYIPNHVKGGLSGLPTQTLSNKLISKTYQEYGHKLTIIGCGGIFSAEDAYEKIRRGASLLQLITGMIYKGPGLIGDINQGLVRRLKQDGCKSIKEAIGSYHH